MSSINEALLTVYYYGGGGMDCVAIVMFTSRKLPGVALPVTEESFP